MRAFELLPGELVIFDKSYESVYVYAEPIAATTSPSEMIDKVSPPMLLLVIQEVSFPDNGVLCVYKGRCGWIMRACFEEVQQ